MRRRGGQIGSVVPRGRLLTQQVTPLESDSRELAELAPAAADKPAAAESSYARIFKSTVLLGGSSIVNVGLGVVRTKVLAVQLGPSIFGTMGLYSALTGMVGAVASLGVGQSAIRDIAAACGSGDQERMKRTIFVVRRVMWVTGMLGMLATVAIAYPASWWTFDTGSHAGAIAVLSVTVLAAQLAAGQMALLQGQRRIRDLTAVNVIGAVMSTGLAIPLLLIFRERGIVPFLVAVAFGQVMTSWWYARRIPVSKVTLTWRETYGHSRDMVHLGLAFMVSSMAFTGSAYVVRLIIRWFAGEQGVGLYQSAFTISSIYVGFILQAMAGDYYPRLATVHQDIPKRNRLVNEQVEMALLLALPGLVGALLLSDVLIWLMYSSRFAGASGILRWQVPGLMFRVICWPLGYILLACGDKHTVMWSEIVGALVCVALTWIGVAWLGVVGAGAAFAGFNLVEFAMIWWIVRRRHNYAWHRGTERLLYLSVTAVMVTFGTTFIANTTSRLLAGGIVLVLVAGHSLNGLLHRLRKPQLAVVAA
jgi:enterobacterial common antigen flippase